MKFQINDFVRGRIMVGWVLAWNVLLGAGIWMNGGLGRIRVASAAWPMFLALAGSCAFCLALLLSTRTRDWALRPGKEVEPIRLELMFMALLLGGLAVATLYGVLGDHA